MNTQLIEVGSRVVDEDGSAGQVVSKAMEYHAGLDEQRTLVGIDWAEGQPTQHLLDDFAQHGGKIQVEGAGAQDAPEIGTDGNQHWISLRFDSGKVAWQFYLSGKRPENQAEKALAMWRDGATPGQIAERIGLVTK